MAIPVKQAGLITDAQKKRKARTQWAIAKSAQETIFFGKNSGARLNPAERKRYERDLKSNAR